MEQSSINKPHPLAHLVHSCWVYEKPKAALIQPKQGDFSKILSLLKNLCGGCETTLAFVLRWIAYPLQNPGAKMGSALVIANTPACGKSVFFELIMKSIYADYATAVNHYKLESSFNYWLSKKLFVICDGITQDNFFRRTVKNLITSDHIVINEKGIAPKEEVNRLNFVFILEDEFFQLPDMDDRHLIHLKPLPSELDSIQTAVAQAKNGGIEAFLYFLLSIDLTGFNSDSYLAKPSMPFAFS